jgi:outer membrane protein assembly factor BamB
LNSQSEDIEMRSKQDRKISTHSLLGAAVLVFVLTVLATGSDAQWAQWGGPNRNFKAPGDELSQNWPDGGPKAIWRRELGGGNSAISVEDGVLYTMYRKGEEEITIAIDAATGQTKWEFSQTVPLWEGLNAGYGPGPHSTPIIEGDLVYSVGAKGQLVCLNKETGEKVWAHDLWEEFGAKPGNRGYASSPMVYKANLIVQVGGQGKGIVAFDLKTGTVAWSGGDFQGAYSSPIVINVDGQDQLILFVENLAVGMDPTSGEVLWQHDHETRYKLNISTPIWGEDNLLFISSAYDTGSRVLHLSQKDGKTTVEEKWYSRKMQVQHGTAVRSKIRVYGSSGGSGPSFLTAIDVRTGEIAVRQRGFSKANLLAVGDQILVLDEDGEFALASAKPDSFVVHAQSKVLSTRSWTVPTVVGTTVYLRDIKEIVALDLSQK